MSHLRIALLSCFLFVTSLYAGCYPPSCCDTGCRDWYAVIGTGYAFSKNLNVSNDPAVWDFANEGYDSNVGNAPFISFGLGKKICNFLDFDVTYTFFLPFHYQKFQTGVSTTVGFTGDARTRFFDFEHKNLMFNFQLDPSCWDYCRYQIFCLQISPIGGIGIGAGFNQVSNFHTVGFELIGETTGVGSTTSIGFPFTGTSFAWQGNIGLRFQKICSSLSFDLGYRYYDGGRFDTPGDVVLNTLDTLGAISPGPGWRCHFKANEVYFNMNFLF